MLLVIDSILLAIFLILTWIILLPKLRFWRWKHSTRIRNAYQAYQQLYTNVDGVTLSKQDRQKNDRYELTYGESNFFTLAAILDFIDPKDNSVFYDLGSGTGKVVICSALLYPFKKNYGIEILPSLYHAAKSVQQKLKNPQKIHFFHEDFFDHDISDGDIIFVNATGYFSDNKEKLFAKLSQTKSKTWIIIVSKKIPDENFRLIDAKRWPMSWGDAMIYLYQKR